MWQRRRDSNPGPRVESPRCWATTLQLHYYVYSFLVAYDTPTNHVSKVFWNVVIFLFPPIILIVLSYTGRGLDPQFMVAICAYLVVAGLVDCDGIITEFTHYYV